MDTLELKYLDELARIVVVVVVVAAAVVATAVAVATTSSKHKTRMNNWIRCKHFYSEPKRLGTSFKLIG